MHVQPFSAAAQVGSISAQSTAKDSSQTPSAAGHTGAGQAADLHVEQSGESSPDRDAQGQGDGLPADHQPGEEAGHDEQSRPAANSPDPAPAPNLPGEPPSQLDLLG